MKMYTSIRLIRRFEPPIPISNLIGSLEFIKDKKNYGLNLRLPRVNISLSDHRRITDSQVIERER